MSSEIGNFTPVSHSLAQEVGLVCAAVYGVVWRYCQMKDGICKASLDTLGSDISVDRATVMRSIKKLCELGYLLDQTPDRRNAPHTYILSKSVAQCNSSMDTPVVIRSESEAETVAHNNNSKQSVAQSNATVAQSNRSVAQSHLKIDKETLKDTPNGVGKKPSVQKVEDTDKTTPLWQLMNEFVKQSGIPMPLNAKRKGEWFGSLREIYEIANRDVDVGKRLIRDAIEEARQGNWKVYRPGSLVRTAGRLMAKPKPRITAL